MSQQPGGSPQSPDNPAGSAPQDGFPQPGAYPQQPYPGQPGYPVQHPYPGQLPYPGQQPYPTAAYGQQPAGQPYQQTPYGQQQADNPYQITHYAAQYAAQGQQPQYPVQPAYADRPLTPEARSPMLGMIGFGLVVVSLVAMIAAIIPITDFIIANADLTAGPGGLESNRLAEMLVEQFPMQAMALNLFGFTGFAGWVVGIVAAATRRGRMWGVLAIVIGTLAPFILVGVMVAVMMPAIAAR